MKRARGIRMAKTIKFRGNGAELLIQLYKATWYNKINPSRQGGCGDNNECPKGLAEVLTGIQGKSSVLNEKTVTWLTAVGGATRSTRFWEPLRPLLPRRWVRT